MPIANCIVAPDTPCEAHGIRARRAELCASAADEMTLSIVERNDQVGRAYPIMTTLRVASCRSERDRQALQKGLVQALSEVCGVPLDAIHLMARPVESGWVVDRVEW